MMNTKEREVCLGMDVESRSWITVKDTEVRAYWEWDMPNSISTKRSTETNETEFFYERYQHLFKYTLQPTQARLAGL